ncbi:MAG: glycosyltransferase family 39 protein [Candidatus Omnitrophota bacterium]
MIILKSFMFLLFLTASSGGWGRVFLRKDMPSAAHFALGFGVISYLSLIFGLAGFFYPVILLSIYLAGFFIFLLDMPEHLKKLFSGVRSLKDAALTYKFSLLLLSFVLVAVFIKTLSPPAGINDSLAYHLNCPKVFLQNHKVFAIPYDVDCAMPFFMEMLFTLGVALKDAVFSKLVSYLMGFLLIYAIYDFTKRYISQKYSVLAALIFALTPVVYVHMSYAYVELGLAFYLFMSFYMFYEWLEEKKTSFLLLSAVFMGFALSIKAFAGFLLPAFCLYIIIRGIVKRRGFSSTAKEFILFAFFSFIFSFAWYVRAYIISGNPIYPYLHHLFSDIEPGLLGGYLTPGGYNRGMNILSLLLLPWDMTFYPGMFGGDRISPIYLGILPLAILPVAGLLRKRGDVRFWRPVFFLAAYVLAWFYVIHLAKYLHLTRYLVPMFAFASVLSVYLVAELFAKPLKSAKVVKAVLGSFICIFLILQTGALVYNTRDRIAVALGIETREEYLSREERTYDIAEYINNNLPKNAKILAFSEVRFYYFDRDIVREEIFREFTKYDKKGLKKRELTRFLKEEGFTHVLCLKTPAYYSSPISAILEKKEPIYTENGYYLYEIQ